MGAVVEAEVWEAVERMLSHPALVFRKLQQRQEQAGAQQERMDRERETYQRQLTKMTTERERLLAIYLDGTIARERFQVTDAELAVKEQRIKAELAALDRTVQGIEATTLDLRAVYEFCVQWANQLDHITPEQKAQAVKGFGIVATWNHGKPLAITGEADLGIVRHLLG
jgi:hypothetical protein